jgi:NMD protein affecting ribosome stability and mRNA decay
MPLSKCPRCNKLFEKTRFAVCSLCQEAEEADYEQVREVLERMPNLNAEQVAEETKVDIAVIARMVKEGLVTNTLLQEHGAKCGMCGAPAISLSKKLCQSCLEKLNVRVTKMQGQVKLNQKKNVQVDAHLGSARKSFEKKRRTP